MWEHAWSTARATLRLSDSEFWTLTPRKLALLRGRHEEELARQEHAAGVIAAAVVNIMGNPREDYQPSDFFGSRWAREIRRRKQTAERSERDQQAIAAAFRKLMSRTPKAEQS